MTTELPLLFFTILTQIAVGLAIISAIRQWAAADGPQSKAGLEWGVITGVLLVGIFAAFFHLGNPLGAVRMLTNLGTAWLSREILAFAAFAVLVIVTLITAFRKSVNSILAKVTALVGVLALIATGMTYAAPSMVAVYNLLPLVFFSLTALILGSSIASYFAPQDKQGLLVKILAVSLIVALVIYLSVPFIWLSGGTVMQASGKAYLGSILYWVHILIGLGFPLLVVWRMKRIPPWLPIFLLAGEFAGRLIFFSLVYSQALFLGGLY
jgi:DMSO reductase anchor subunit